MIVFDSPPDTFDEFKSSFDVQAEVKGDEESSSDDGIDDDSRASGLSGSKSNKPIAITASTSVTDKRTVSNDRIDKMNPMEKLLGKGTGVSERWARQTRDSLCGVDPKCAFARNITLKLSVMDAAERCTAKRMLVYIVLSERNADLKKLVDAEVHIPDTVQEAVTERTVLDLSEDPAVAIHRSFVVKCPKI